MLKRCQILLEDWQFEHIKLVAEEQDLSLSELVRILVCEGLLMGACSSRFKYKEKFDTQAIYKISEEGSSPQVPLERRHQLASKLYFEARKAAEHMSEQIAKERKNNQK